MISVAGANLMLGGLKLGHIERVRKGRGGLGPEATHVLTMAHLSVLILKHRPTEKSCKHV